jgi:hypothetical protein
MTHKNFQVFRVLGPTLRMKAQADSSSRGQKDFICREEKGCMGACWETWKPGSHGSGWKLGFYSLFLVARGQRYLSGANRQFPGKEKCLLGQLPPFGTSCYLSFIYTYQTLHDTAINIYKCGALCISLNKKRNSRSKNIYARRLMITTV